MSTNKPAVRPKSARARFLCAVVALLVLGWSYRGLAHAPVFSVYSKYEATTSGKSIAIALALDKAAVLLLLEHEVSHSQVTTDDVSRYRDFFSKYVFERLSVSNDGAPCDHPNQLGRFFWDEPTKRVLAVTKFTCADELDELTIHSLVTHDMPISHALVGDLVHGRALIRSYFSGDSTDARITVRTLPQNGEPIIPRPPSPILTRGKISYVPLPDTLRRYDALAAAELGVDVSSISLPSFAAPGSSPPPPEKPAGLFAFIGQGILHIFTGYDHVLFIVTLMLVVRSWKELAIIVTSFTAAHSLTLAVATLGLVTIPSRYVEPLIALTVLFVAVDGILRPDAKARAVVAFGFGLIHGLGLSNALRELGLSGRELLPALFGFNIGVEIGQLLIVGPLFWLVLWLRKRETLFVRTRNVMCASVALIAVFWIVVRVREALLG